MESFALARSGDPEALGALVGQHLPLVQALCRRFSAREDAFQQGCVGLVKAIRRFDPDAGCMFSTYAVPVILGEMKKTLHREVGWRSRAALRKAKEFQDAYFQQFGRMPAVADAAGAAGLAPAELCLLMEMTRGPQYDETGELLSSIPDPHSERWFVRFCVRDILSRMPDEERWLLAQRFFLGLSQTELAKQLRVPQYRLSRREKKARARFRDAWLEE